MAMGEDNVMVHPENLSTAYLSFKSRQQKYMVYTRYILSICIGYAIHIPESAMFKFRQFSRSGNACKQHGISGHQLNFTQKSSFTTRQYIPGISCLVVKLRLDFWPKFWVKLSWCTEMSCFVHMHFHFLRHPLRLWKLAKLKHYCFRNMYSISNAYYHILSINLTYTMDLHCLDLKDKSALLNFSGCNIALS